MHGIDGALLQVVGICIVTAFFAQLLLNRRSLLVALCVAPAIFVVMIAIDYRQFGEEFSVLAPLRAFLALFGGFAALIGAASARFLRLWLESKLGWTAPKSDKRK